MASRFKSLLGLAALLLIREGVAQPNPVGATDPNYLLAVGDTIQVSVVGEPELVALELIDRDGKVRLPLLEEVVVHQQTVRAAEEALAAAYVAREYLRKPQVRIVLMEYAPRFVTVLGAVSKRGKISFPKDTQSIDLIDVINDSGGLLPTARGDQVNLIRVGADGKETVEVINYDAMVNGKRTDEAKSKSVKLLAGDRIFVPERLF